MYLINKLLLFVSPRTKRAVEYLLAILNRSHSSNIVTTFAIEDSTKANRLSTLVGNMIVQNFKTKTSRSLHVTLLSLVLSSLVSSASEIGQIANKNDNQKRLDLNDPTSYFANNEPPLRDFDGKLTFDEYISYSMRSLSLVVGWDADLHRYDSKSSLISSFARNLTYLDDLSRLKAHIDPSELALLNDQSELTVLENERNQARCGKHLDRLILATSELLVNASSFSQSKQLNLIDYLDSFGWPNSQLMMGNHVWLGSHEQCVKSSLEDIEPQLNSRYCIAKLRSPHWSASSGIPSDNQTIKLGVCLPDSCNSISLLRHKYSIEVLIKLTRLGQSVPFSNYKLVDLYCLPDESSPLRQFSLSAKIFILTLSGWLTIVIYYSLRYEYRRMKRLGVTGDTIEMSHVDEKLTQILAIRVAIETLFAKCAQSSNKSTTNIVRLSLDQQKQVKRFETKVSNVILTSSELTLKHDKLGKSNETGQNLPAQTKADCIDLSAINGIKVLSMMWLISGHTLLFFLRTIANGRDFWSILRDARYMTVMAGIFPVDTFFTITGFLTAYLKFSKNDGEAMHKFSYWIEAFVHRYLRFMPMYLIIFWYTRDVSEYIGYGPLWDYATADTSIRSTCKQESFSTPLLFQANFKRIDLHCVKPAWYLANDYQYLLITPIFFSLLMRSRTLGYYVIGLSVFASLCLQFLTVFFSRDIDDFSVVINFEPMFATQVLMNLWKLYVLPYNRIPPYLIGILTGHLLYTWNKNCTASKKGINNSSKNSCCSTQDSSVNSDNNSEHNGDHKILDKKGKVSSHESAFNSYICTKVWTPLVLLISIIYLPILTRFSTQEGQVAKIGTSSIIALMRFVWSLAIARLIYICASKNIMKPSLIDADGREPTSSDSFIIRFLSSPKWKPWSQIGLSALLIQWEVISYLAQTQSSIPQMTITFLFAIVLICIVVTYTLALIIYLTIEYPLSQLEQHYIHSVLFRNT